MNEEDQKKAEAIFNKIISKGYSAEYIAIMYAMKVVEYENTDAYKYRKLYEEEKKKLEDIQRRIVAEKTFHKSDEFKNRIQTIRNLMNELDIIRTEVLEELE